jgi:hypothetical protein
MVELLVAKATAACAGYGYRYGVGKQQWRKQPDTNDQQNNLNNQTFWSCL